VKNVETPGYGKPYPYNQSGRAAGYRDHTLLIATRKIRWTFHHENRRLESPRFLLLPVVIRQDYTPVNLATNIFRPYSSLSPGFALSEYRR
jgi:hypothetical protein